MPGGVFMSTGNARTAGDLTLVVTGMSIARLVATGMVLRYIVA